VARLEPRDHTVSLSVAAAYTRRHRGTLSGAKQHGDHGGAFHADQVLKLLQQPGCTALRIYHGRGDKNDKAMVLVGVDADGNDMTKGLMLEIVMPCPPFCDDASPLIT
jgi:hypothetical protein